MKNKIEITNLTVKKLSTLRKAKAIATIVINDAIRINDIRVIENDNRLFIAMPAHKTQEGDFKDIVHPVDKDTRKIIETAILEAYKKEIQ